MMTAMPKPTVVARLLEGDRLQCQISSPWGLTLTLAGSTTDVEPEVIEGAEQLSGNRALVDNAWAFAKFTHLKVSLPSPEEQKRAEQLADAHHATAEWLADLADDVTHETASGWCSGCFAAAEHRKVRMPAGRLPAYVCSNCGSGTLPCAGPGCDNMAVRGRGGVRLPRYCAEHRHDIPGFEKAQTTIDSLSDYEEFLEFDKPNLSRMTKLVGVSLAGLAVGGPFGTIASEAIGGAVGTLVGGYTGAAASSYGLALLGGGSLAAGGIGMAGGTLVVAGCSAALGGALGASVTNAYIREDSSFHIEMLRGGSGVPVVVCNGFLSESGKGWGEWKEIVTQRYPDSPVYRVHWGAKELKNLGIFTSAAAVKGAGPAALQQAALAATKSGAKKLGPIAPLLVAAEFAKNPWHVAKVRANKTGIALADLLARTDIESYVLVGHSLGARAMAVAAQALGTKADAPRIQAAHLLGAAIGAESDWGTLTDGVDDHVYNYHSTNDGVLRYVYKAVQGGQAAAGFEGFVPSPPKVRNIDVSDSVKGHSDYHTEVELI